MANESSKPIRVVQWATGVVGASAMRAVIGHPDMELVGVHVHSGQKEGRDAGDLCGLAQVGITATRDLDAILELKPDCVLYMPDKSNVNEVCALLENGANIVTTCLQYYDPAQVDPAVRERIEAACRKGGTSIHSSGSSPGFITEALPIVLLSLQRRLDCLTIDEYADCTGVCSDDMLFNYIGFGEPPEVFAKRNLAQRDACFEHSLSVLANALKLPLDGFETSSDFATARHSLRVGEGMVEAGTVAAQRLILTGLRNGRPLLRMRTNWYVTTDVEPDLELLATGWRVRVQGDAPMDLTINFPVVDEDRPLIMPRYTAHRPVNAVAAVCAAAPGFVTGTDLPQVIPALA